VFLVSSLLLGRVKRVYVKYIVNLRGLVVSIIILALSLSAWIFVIGVGEYASSGKTSEFSVSGLDYQEIVSNSPQIFYAGINEYYNIFFHFMPAISGETESNHSGSQLYFFMIIMMTSPIVFLLFLAYVIKLVWRRKANQDELYLWVWFLFILIFFTFFVSVKQVRFFLPVLPALSIVSALGMISLSERLGSLSKFPEKVFIMVFAIIIFLSNMFLLSGLLSEDTGGFREVGEFIEENLQEGELLYYPGSCSTILLFYYPEQSNYFELRGNGSGLSDVRFVVVDRGSLNMNRRSYSHLVDMEGIVEELDPVAVFYRSPMSLDRFYGWEVQGFDYRYINVYEIADQDKQRFFLA